MSLAPPNATPPTLLQAFHDGLAVLRVGRVGAEYGVKLRR